MRDDAEKPVAVGRQPDGEVYGVVGAQEILLWLRRGVQEDLPQLATGDESLELAMGATPLVDASRFVFVVLVEG